MRNSSAQGSEVMIGTDISNWYSALADTDNKAAPSVDAYIQAHGINPWEIPNIPRLDRPNLQA